MTVRDTLAQNLASYRKAAGLTQTEAAEKLHAKKTTISSWERGQSQPDADRLVEICAIYRVSLNELCGVNTQPMNLTADERKVVEMLRRVDEGTRKAVMKLLDLQ